jgi:hypothetical protein
MKPLILALCVVLASLCASPVQSAERCVGRVLSAPVRAAKGIAKVHPVRRLARCVRGC